MLWNYLGYNAKNTNLMPTMRTAKNDFTKIIYSELSYKINGILFAVRQELGGYCNEKQYCDLIEAKLKNEKIAYEREKILLGMFEGEQEGRHWVAFLIDVKIILEAKTKRFLTREDYYQLKRYLSVLRKKLGIIVNFHQKYIQPKRILNSSATE